MTISSSVFGTPYITTSNKLYVKVTTGISLVSLLRKIICKIETIEQYDYEGCFASFLNKNSDVQLRERKKNALQIVHLCLAQSEIAKAFDDGRAVPFVELESDCFVPAWLCIRPVITQAQQDQILYNATF